MTDASPPLGTRRIEVPAAAPPSFSANAVLLALAFVAVLYFGREIFVPIALAVLLSFVLAPLTRLLRRWHAGRAGSVLVAVVLAFLVIFGIGALIARQVAQLADNLPQYQVTVSRKIQALRGSASSGTVERASAILKDLQREITGTEAAPPAPAKTPSAAQPKREAVKPIPVEIREPPPRPLQLVQSVVSPLLQPLATAGIVVVFVIFVLLYREDLRDRFIRLAGSHDLRRTTEAMDDAAHRLSRYFLTQTAINAAFGVVIGVGLWLIGIPNPALWGVIGMLMRFVPYVGAIIAALLPAVLAIAVDPGWSMLLWTVALFAIVEPIMGQVVEPWLYGHNTGLSPVAVVVAAAFWTWLWGPIGLLLSTPLTVCLVVLGRHTEQLQFLDVVLGDQPALTPEESFYQRMLAGDPDEAAEQAELFLKEKPLSAYYDEVVIPALALAQADAKRGTFDLQRLVDIRETVGEVIDDLADHEDVSPAAAHARNTAGTEPHKADAAPLPVLAAEELAPSWRDGKPVLCVSGRGPLDEAASHLLAQLLEKHGIGVRVEPFEALKTANLFRLDISGVALVCMSYLDPGTSAAQARYLIRRLRRKLPKALILAGFWTLEEGSAELEAMRRAAGADLYATSLREALRLCLEAAATPPADAAGPVISLDRTRTEVA